MSMWDHIPLEAFGRPPARLQKLTEARTKIAPVHGGHYMVALSWELEKCAGFDERAWQWSRN